MKELDRIMIQEYKIPVEFMMEHAGLNFARLATNYLNNPKIQIKIIAGKGNNAGGGIVAARRLASWGVKTQVYIVKGTENLNKVPKRQLFLAQQVGIEIKDGLPMNLSNKDDDNLILDAYVGYNFTVREDEVTENVFEYLRSQKNVISLDLPSGLDANTGKSYSHVKPRATLTLAFLKHGLIVADKIEVGDLFVADIGIPMNLIKRVLKGQWDVQLHQNSLTELVNSFRLDSMQKVKINKTNQAWTIM